MKLRGVSILAVFLATIALIAILPFAQVAVWDGRFLLAIEIDSAQPIDLSNLTFATCWRKEEAENTVQTRDRGGPVFEPADDVGHNQVSVSVPCSGREGFMEDSYFQPSYLVVEYPVVGADNDERARKLVEIPQGRGPRTIRITLP